MPSFERSPVAGGKSDAYKVEEVRLGEGGSLHEVLLSGWGCPIGEMFDLEGLAKMCRKEGRSSFFVSSVPLKVGPLVCAIWIREEGTLIECADGGIGARRCCESTERCRYILTVNREGLR